MLGQGQAGKGWLRGKIGEIPCMPSQSEQRLPRLLFPPQQPVMVYGSFGCWFVQWTGPTNRGKTCKTGIQQYDSLLVAHTTGSLNQVHAIA